MVKDAVTMRLEDAQLAVARVANEMEVARHVDGARVVVTIHPEDWSELESALVEWRAATQAFLAGGVSSPHEEFFILSMERTGAKNDSGGPVCVWWRPGAAGYTALIGEAGRFSREEALRHSDPPHHLAIPCSTVSVPASRAKDFAKKALTQSRFKAIGEVKS